MNPVELSREDVAHVRAYLLVVEANGELSITQDEILSVCNAALRYLKLREGHPGITISTDNGVKLAGEALDREVDL